MFTDSEKALLGVLYRQGSTPRAVLTSKVALSQQSVHRLLDGLLLRNVVVLGEAVAQGRGKPSPQVALNPSAFASIGLSVTTEAVHCAAFDFAGHLVVEVTLDAHPNEPTAVLRTLDTQLQTWRDSCLCDSPLLGIGVAMQGYRCGQVDTYYTPPPLAAWRSIALTDYFQPLAPTVLSENNATASAMAEAYIGGGQGIGHFVYLSFNYGFGGGIFYDGQALSGAHGNAGELSSMFAVEKMPVRPALGELLQRLQAGHREVDSFATLHEWIDLKDPIVQRWLDDIEPQLMHVLLALKAILDPQAIFFGGEAPYPLREHLIARLQDKLAWQSTPNPKLLVSAIEGDAAHYGAALLPLHHFVYQVKNQAG